MPTKKPCYPCDAYNDDKETVALVHAQMPDAAAQARLLGLLKTAADPTRFRLLYALARHEMCVCELAALVTLPSTAVSHQLRYLRERGFITFRKQGKFAFYHLVDEALRRLLNDMMAAVESEPATSKLKAIR